jgi:hypothetical protein
MAMVSLVLCRDQVTSWIRCDSGHAVAKKLLPLDHPILFLGNLEGHENG